MAAQAEADPRHTAGAHGLVSAVSLASQPMGHKMHPDSRIGDGQPSFRARSGCTKHRCRWLASERWCWRPASWWHLSNAQARIVFLDLPRSRDRDRNALRYSIDKALSVCIRIPHTFYIFLCAPTYTYLYVYIYTLEEGPPPGSTCYTIQSGSHGLFLVTFGVDFGFVGWHFC